MLETLIMGVHLQSSGGRVFASGVATVSVSSKKSVTIPEAEILLLHKNSTT